MVKGQLAMTKALLNFIVAACLLGGWQVLGDGTNAVLSPTNADAANAFVQIQAQLHETQMEVESNRAQMVSALQNNANSLNNGLQLLEQRIADERANDAAAAQKVEHTTLVASGIGLLALAAVVTMVFLQLRTATRLIELALSSPQPALSAGRAMPVVETAQATAPSARAVIENSNARLIGVIDRLEKRILELENTTRAPLNEPDFGGVIPQTPATRRVDDLVVEGQLFLDTNKPEKAISCFDSALELQPNLPEALIKKAAALEKTERLDEALACYDRAIENEESATTALLQKGGLLNRMARYEEALQCYEQALRTQEKKTGAEPAVVNS